MKTTKKLAILKANDEDFEWYPTSDEILTIIRNDILSFLDKQELAYKYILSDNKHVDYQADNRVFYFRFNDVLDIGTGDGRFFEHLCVDVEKEQSYIEIKQKYGIELAKKQSDDLIRNNILLLGRDYFETVLVDKQFDIVFSNPPYSIFKAWCSKLINEVNSKIIYLVLPQRWKNDLEFVQLLSEKGEVMTVDSCDFKGADRQARAVVDVIRIIVDRKAPDTFTQWVENNIGNFEINNEDLPDIDELDEKGLKKFVSNPAENLVENYKAEMKELTDTYVALGKINPKLLHRLGLGKSDVIKKLKLDVKNLKIKFWQLTFDTLQEITSRLISKIRKGLLQDITWFEKLDFNLHNIQTIVIWVIENVNKYLKEQLLAVYKGLTDFNKVKAYKSNVKWFKDDWRYEKQPDKYKLDYRIVVEMGYQISKYSYHQDENIIANLAVIGNNLGFFNDGISNYSKGKKHTCYMANGDSLFTYIIYKNDNVHFKLNQKFLQIFNVEVGKINGWIKTPADIVSEFDVQEDIANVLFGQSQLQLLKPQQLLLNQFI